MWGMKLIDPANTLQPATMMRTDRDLDALTYPPIDALNQATGHPQSLSQAPTSFHAHGLLPHPRGLGVRPVTLVASLTLIPPGRAEQPGDEQQRAGRRERPVPRSFRVTASACFGLGARRAMGSLAGGGFPHRYRLRRRGRF